MSETKHTPGPWRVVVSGGTFDAEGKPVAGVFIESGPYHSVCCVMPHDTVKADAHLIAAAPDLLEALKEVIAMLKAEATGTPLNDRKYDGLGAKAYAAIAKAEGK